MHRTKYTFCMTLRLTAEIEEMVAEAAYDRRISKSDFIRLAIRHSLKNPSTAETTGVRK
jgi:hypothetical protein